MGKVRILKTAFVSGELAQQAFGRIDKDFYLKGADKLRNVYVDPLGGVYKREGMKYLTDTYNNGKAKLIEFAFNTEQIYLLVFTHQRMRVYNHDVLVADVTSAILDNVTESILSELKYAQSADTLILVQGSIKPIKITRTSHTNWLVEHVSFEYIPTYSFNGVTVTEPDASISFSSLTGVGVSVVSTSPVFLPEHVKQKIIGKTGGIFNITRYVDAYNVIGDVIVEFPGDIANPTTVNRIVLGKGAWDGGIGYSGSEEDIRYASVQASITLSGILSGVVTATCSMNQPPNSVAFGFLEYIFGRESPQGRFKTTEVIGDPSTTSQLRGIIEQEFPIPQDTNALQYDYTEWQLETGHEEVWSESRGYPKTCSFYQGRLWFGGSTSRPSTLWGSKSGIFFNFDIGSGKADDAIDVTIDDDKINAIVNIFPGRNMQIFTTGGEFYIPQTETDPIKPENIMVQKSTQHGSSNVKPVSVDGGTLFIESSGKVIRQFLFNELERSYNAQSISLLSSQLIRNPVAMAVRQSRDESPADYVYVVNSDGTIAVLNVLRNEQLLAWSLFETNGVVEDLVVVVRDVYLVTRRVINGVTKRFIEKLDRNYFLDAGKKVTSSTPITTFTGFSHLASEDVKVRAGSFVLLDNQVKSNGNIDIELDYKEIEAGLGFSVLVRTLPVDMDLGGKTLTGDWRRIVYALVKTFNSRSFEVHCGRNIFRPVFRSLGSDILDTEITPYNGWKKIYMSGGIKRDAYFDIVQDEPTEFDLISMVIAVTI